MVTKLTLHYYLYPHGSRATPAEAAERYCPNDGTELLRACSHCHAPITSPYSASARVAAWVLPQRLTASDSQTSVGL